MTNVTLHTQAFKTCPTCCRDVSYGSGDELTTMWKTWLTSATLFEVTSVARFSSRGEAVAWARETALKLDCEIVSMIHHDLA